MSFGLSDMADRMQDETVPMSSAELEQLRILLTEVMNSLGELKTHTPIYKGELIFNDKQRYEMQGKLMKARSIVYVTQAREQGES